MRSRKWRAGARKGKGRGTFWGWWAFRLRSFEGRDARWLHRMRRMHGHVGEFE